jgi:CheY-like chemotaxis protein
MISKNTLNLKNFTPTLNEVTTHDKQLWRVLVVDDEADVHIVTQLILEDMQFENHPIEMLSAYSAKEAQKLLAVEKNIAVILLDVVMETDDAGLQLVKYIREDLKDKNVRIILRTGQAGQFPEESVIVSYDINDYKAKNELTAQKLCTAIFTSLRAYQSMLVLDETIDRLKKINDNLEKTIMKANAVQYQKMVSTSDANMMDTLTSLNYPYLNHKI